MASLGPLSQGVCQDSHQVQLKLGSLPRSVFTKGGICFQGHSSGHGQDAASSWASALKPLAMGGEAPCFMSVYTGDSQHGCCLQQSEQAREKPGLRSVSTITPHHLLCEE